MLFRILGCTEVDGAALTVGRNLRVVLAMLLCHPNRPVPVGDLSAAVWGVCPPKSATKNLHGYVHQLRRLVGGERVVRYPHGYGIHVSDDDLDAALFERLLERASTTKDPDQARSLLMEADRLWRGPVFADLADVEPLMPEIARLTDRRLSAWEQRIDIELSLGRHQEVVSDLAMWVGRHPMRERLRGQLMVALYRCGRRADALRQYQEARDVLADELGVEPSQELQDIQLAVLRGIDPEPPSGVDPVAADVDIHADLQVPSQLPPTVTSFVGRSEQIARLDELLERSMLHGGTVVVSAIAGMGGVGKTALATQWARRVQHRFPDGQLCVNLNGYSSSAPMDPGKVAAHFLRALGVNAETIPADRDAAAGLLRSTLSGRQVLLLLDNAGSADQVRPLLPSSSGCFAIVTSRGRLDGLVARDGAVRIDLSQLTLTDSLTLLGDLLQDRVAKEPVAATELVVACGYLPLAIRVSAAHLMRRPRMKLAEMVRELLSDRLATLEVSDDPHTSVRLVLSHSYGRLPTDAQRLFRLIGDSPCSDFTARSCEVMTALPPEDATAALQNLAQTGLLDEHLPGRYQPHDLSRDYGRYLAGLDRDDQAAQRQAQWILAATDTASRAVYPIITRIPHTYDRRYDETFTSPSDALLWLDAEWHNIAALAARSHSWILVDSLRGYAYLRGLLNELEGLACNALAAAAGENSEIGQAACLLAIGTAHRYRNDLTEAVRHFTAATSSAARAGWDEGQAGAHANLSETLYRLSRTHEALQHAQEALALNTRIGNVRGVAGNQITIGNILHQIGRLREAIYHDGEAIRLARELGALHSEMTAQYNRARTMRCLGDFPSAIEHLLRARAITEELGLSDHVLASLGLANIYLEQGRLDQAAAELNISEEAAEDTLDNVFQHDVIGAHAALLHARGRTDRAHHLTSRQLREANLQPMQRVHLQIESAKYLLDLGMQEEGGRLCAELLAIADDPSYGVASPAIYLTAAKHAHLQGNEVDALAYAHQAIDRATATGQQPTLARSLLHLGEVLGPENAEAELTHARRICSDIGLPELAQAEKLLAQIG